jgi:hypothetical protein
VAKNVDFRAYLKVQETIMRRRCHCSISSDKRGISRTDQANTLRRVVNIALFSKWPDQGNCPVNGGDYAFLILTKR